jgi:UDP-N-acetylmuramate dehydrogenase
MVEVMAVLTSSDIMGQATGPDARLDEVARTLRDKMRGDVRRSEPMAMHTTFRVGGPADLFLAPQDDDDLALVLATLAQAEIPLTLLGNGSNLLVADAGVRGAVVRLTPHFAQIARDGDTLQVGAGAKLGRVVHVALAEGLSGLESTMGIPGTIGGALVMNAGTDVGSISDLVEETRCLTAAGEPVVLSGADLAYGYRHSALQGSGLIVVDARLRLAPGEKDAIKAKMERLEEKRTSRQPTRCRTAGSTFKNQPDIAAGKLIDRAGCKGHRIGGAEVSEKHANFIIAHPGATAGDIRNLANWMHRRVRDAHDRDLEMEVELVGDWSGWTADEEA